MVGRNLQENRWTGIAPHARPLLEQGKLVCVERVVGKFVR